MDQPALTGGAHTDRLKQSVSPALTSSDLARYVGHTHTLYAAPLRCWFARCEARSLDPLVGTQRAHLELYTRHLGERGLMSSSVNTLMLAVRGFFRFAHIDGRIVAVYARLPKIRDDDSRRHSAS